MEKKEEKEKFEIYERIRKSGKTNMFAITEIVELSDGELTRDDIFDIMNNYLVLHKKYGGK